MVVQNMDVAGLIRRIRRFKQEIHKCNSAGLMFVTEKDLERIQSYFDSLNVYFDWMMSQPMQDFVKWHPTDIDLGVAPTLEAIENEALWDLLVMFEGLEVEVGLSGSAGMHTSMQVPDETRFREIIEKMGNFLTDYISEVQPLDVPESSPKAQLAGKGKLSRSKK